MNEQLEDERQEALAEDHQLREDAGVTIVLRCRVCNEKVILHPNGTETRSCDHKWPEEAL